MKLHILNDLHIEFEDFTPPVTDAGVVVLAGDIGAGLRQQSGNADGRRPGAALDPWPYARVL
jgi:hypothetical protein